MLCGFSLSESRKIMQLCQNSEAPSICQQFPVVRDCLDAYILREKSLAII